VTLPPRPLSKIPLKTPKPAINKHLTLGKFNNTTPHHTFDVSLHCLPEHIQEESQNLHHFDLPAAIALIREHTQPPLAPNPWKFERTHTAALHNTNLLKSFNFNPEVATQSIPNTTLSYGSEFKPAHILQPLLQFHQHWPSFQEIVNNGVSYPLQPINEEDRLSDIDALIERGNHKSAQTPDNTTALNKSFNKEVLYEWAIPITPTCIKLIPGASVTPLGVAVQFSINGKGDRILKRRTTHDCTFPGPSGASCNNRVITELLDECKYGHALTRFLHGIHDIRRRHPTKVIWINKTDMDAAYRRLHTNMSAAITCITIINQIAYLLLRVPFGASPAPTKFSSISDTAADVAHDLAMDTRWDPATLHSSFDLDNMTPDPPPTAKMGQADPLLINLPPRDIVTDNFIDDLFQACASINDNDERIRHAAPLVLETIFRMKDANDPTKRDPIINLTKHEAEGKLEVRKTILGWLIDSHQFKVFLTQEKAKDWIHDTKLCISTGYCTKETLESLIGRFNHTGMIIHMGRYFLTRLRYRLQQYSTFRKNKRIKLLQWDIKDLKLWLFFLHHLSHTGVSINNICLSAPSAITYSDACEWGIGGYTTHGNAWRYLLPTHLRGRASINMLEFIAAIVTIHLSITKDTHTTSHPHILAFTDSSSAAGWLYHSTFNPIKNKCHDDMARYLARLLFKHNATIHPEHIPGKDNDVADSLSRDFHLNNTDLLTLLTPQLTHTHAQGPHTLKISSPPPTITSWIASMVGSLPQTKESLPRPSLSSLARSQNFRPTSLDAGSPTPSWTPTHNPNKLSSCQDMHTTSDTADNSKPSLRPPFKATRSLPPSHMWFRPSGRTFGLTPHMTRLGQNPPSSADNSKLTETVTQHARAKHASQSKSG
jgi:hypothetical protein